MPCASEAMWAAMNVSPAPVTRVTMTAGGVWVMMSPAVPSAAAVVPTKLQLLVSMAVAVVALDS